MKFGKEHNNRLILKFSADKERLMINECGGLFDWRKMVREILEVVIFVKREKTGNSEIDRLIDELPTYNKFNS